MNRRGLILSGIAIGAAMLFAAAILLRPSILPRAWRSSGSGSREAAPSPVLSPGAAARAAVTAVNPASQGRALHDASLLGLIRNARVASRKKDEVTRSAMLNGLKKDAVRSKQLIEQEVTRAADAGDAEALRGLLAELQ